MTQGQRGLLWLALVATGCEVGLSIEAAQECGESECGTESTGHAEDEDTEAPGATPVDPAVPTAVDVLVVLDNSGWMAEEQDLVGSQLGGLVDALTEGGFDARFAATTTDAGNYWCRSSLLTEPAFGRFQTNSCLERLDEFHYGGDGSNAESVCTDHCSLPSVRTEPGVPWVEASTSGTNLRDGADAAEASTCLALAGINGCGFEAPLEAMSLSLAHAQNPQSPEFGFLREDAHLLVVFISDEADCSANPAVEDLVFAEGGIGTGTFWPERHNGPSSAICWNAGVACEGGDCWPEDYDTAGRPTDNPEDAALIPVSRYLDTLADVRAQKQAQGAEVFVFGILGVPLDYPETRSLTYARGPDGDDPDSFQGAFGTAPGCVSAVGEAVPPVRLRAVIESDRMSAANNIYSICAADYAPAFEAMAEAVLGYGDAIGDS